MAFGAPTRALFVPQEDAERWDMAIQQANDVYRGRMHNLCCDNCHSHVANALNRMPAKAYGIESWDMVKLALLVFVRGVSETSGILFATIFHFSSHKMLFNRTQRFLSWGGVFAQFGPFALIMLLVLFFQLKK